MKRFDNSPSALGRGGRRPGRACLATVFSLCALALTGPVADASTVGLNQIITATVAPKGQLSLCYQYEAPTLGDRHEFLAVLGATDKLEVNVGRTFDSPDNIFAAEYGLVQKPNLAVSTGFLNWATSGGGPEPFVNADVTVKSITITGGVFSVPTFNGSQRATEIQIGEAYAANPKLLLQVDYMTGSENASTIGCSYQATPNWNLNPAIYRSNDSSHTLSGFVFVTYSMTAYK